MKEKCCCFTGHRPDKMNLGEKETKPLLEKAIDEAINAGFDTFITGMAMGTDIWAAEIVLHKKKTMPGLSLICALPHPGFKNRRSFWERNKFQYIVDRADRIEEISNHYYPGCYQVRNQWMVNRSGLVIAVYAGEKGGTRNTLLYAQRKGVCINNVLYQDRTV